jgi:CIC family chloride channel protein
MTAAIIIFELTDEYRIILPLLFAVSLATGVANLLTEDTIYTLKLRRRGIDITKRDSDNLMRRLHVSDAMQPPPRALAQHTSVGDAVARFTEQRSDALPVIDRDGHYRGTVTARQLEEAMRESAMSAPIGDLASETPNVREEDTLDEALEVLVNHEFPGLPVLNGDTRIVGWLTHRDVLREYVRCRNGAGSETGRPDLHSPPR